MVSTNFYWRAPPEHRDDLTALNELPVVTLEAKAERKDKGGNRYVTVTVHNPSKSIALMVHLQLRKRSSERVLPTYYSDNCISLVPNESQTITMEAAKSKFDGQDALVLFDGWNISMPTAQFHGVAVAPNLEA